jgi:hypothetical protein
MNCERHRIDPLRRVPDSGVPELGLVDGDVRDGKLRRWPICSAGFR